MTPEDFYAAKMLEREDWEYQGINDDGSLSFLRNIGPVLYSLTLRVSE